VLVVQKAGIKAMPFNAIPKCAARFENNTLHLATGFFCTSAIALQNYFQKGNKVYPLKIEVNPGKGKIVFRVVSCDERNRIDPPTGFKGDVEFEFPKGYEQASAGEVGDTIGQIFAINNDDQQQDQANAQDRGQQSYGDVAARWRPAASCQRAIIRSTAARGAADCAIRHDDRSGAICLGQARQSFPRGREANVCSQGREGDVH